MSKNRLWLLAHQDDEILGLHLVSTQASNYVVYLTDGERLGSKYKSVTRIEEARSSWNHIDRNAELIFFGTYNSLRDGLLESQIKYSHLRNLISICEDRKIEEIVTLQFEGGHHDHDITSLIAEELSKRLNLSLIAFPGYRTLHQKFPFYVVMFSTKKINGKNIYSVFKRIRFAKLALTLMMNYKSQTITWMGLGPFVVFRYLFGKLDHISLSSDEKIRQEIPIKFLYVNRKIRTLIDYENFRNKISGW